MPSICESDIVMILGKIKAKVVRERINILPSFKEYDCQNERVITKTSFIRALTACDFGLSRKEIDTIMKVCVFTKQLVPNTRAHS